MPRISLKWMLIFIPIKDISAWIIIQKLLGYNTTSTTKWRKIMITFPSIHWNEHMSHIQGFKLVAIERTTKKTISSLHLSGQSSMLRVPCGKNRIEVLTCTQTVVQKWSARRWHTTNTDWRLCPLAATTAWSLAVIGHWLWAHNPPLLC